MCKICGISTVHSTLIKFALSKSYVDFHDRIKDFLIRSKNCTCLDMDTDLKRDYINLLHDIDNFKQIMAAEAKEASKAAKQAIREQAKIEKDRERKLRAKGDDDSFDPVKILIAVNDDFTSNYLYVPGVGYYRYLNEKFYWKLIDEKYVDIALMQFIPSNKSRYVNELRKFFDAIVTIPEDCTMYPNRYLLSLNNCIMDLRTGKIMFNPLTDKQIDASANENESLSDPDIVNGLKEDAKTVRSQFKNHRITVKLPLNYNKDAKCPMWDKFIKDVIDDEHNEKIVQEFMGYCLIPETRFEKALILYGEGANGKSTFINVMRNIIGEENTCAVSMSDLNDQYTLAHLKDKLVNFGSELEVGEMSDTSMLKALISGDKIKARNPYEMPFDYKPFVRFVFAMNSLPRMRDKTVGIYRKLIIINFRKQFLTNPNRSLFEELMTERDGILNWCLEGLERLYTQKSFTTSLRAQQELDAYKIENNLTMQFLSDFVEYDPELNSWGEFANKIEIHELYDKFKNWIYNCGHKVISIQTMKMEAKRMYGEKLIKRFEMVRDKNGLVVQKKEFMVGFKYKEGV